MSKQRHWAVRPLKNGTEEKIAGYKFLHDIEARLFGVTLNRHEPLVDLWFECLNLFIEGIKGDFESDETYASPEFYSWSLRLRLISSSTATAKLCMDASLAGYYSGAVALIRHMLETWKMVAYLRLVPESSPNWLPHSTTGLLQTPSDTTINKGIRKKGSPVDRNNLNHVLDAIKECNEGAHPSMMSITHSETGNVGKFQLGGNYKAYEAQVCLLLGSLSVTMLLSELGRLNNAPEHWWNRLHTLNNKREQLERLAVVEYDPERSS